jgi:hypothetical protein
MYLLRITLSQATGEISELGQVSRPQTVVLGLLCQFRRLSEILHLCGAANS